MAEDVPARNLPDHPRSDSVEFPLRGQSDEDRFGLFLIGQTSAGQVRPDPQVGVDGEELVEVVRAGPVEHIVGRLPHQARAASRSAQRSSRFSMPTLNRMSPSGTVAGSEG